MPRKDPVTPDLRLRVLRRDGGCVAPRLGSIEPCRSRFGFTPSPWTHLELDHVKDRPMLGKRAPSDDAHLVTLCHLHHQGGWATANRPVLRAYLRHVTAHRGDIYDGGPFPCGLCADEWQVLAR